MLFLLSTCWYWRCLINSLQSNGAWCCLTRLGWQVEAGRWRRKERRQRKRGSRLINLNKMLQHYNYSRFGGYIQYQEYASGYELHFSSYVSITLFNSCITQLHRGWTSEPASYSGSLLQLRPSWRQCRTISGWILAFWIVKCWPLWSLQWPWMIICIKGPPELRQEVSGVLPSSNHDEGKHLSSIFIS